MIHPSARLIDAESGRVVAGGELSGLVAAAADTLGAVRAPGPVFALTPTDVGGVVRYLGAFAARRAVVLLDPAMPALPGLVERFAPAVVTGVTGAAPGGYRDADLPGLGPVWLRTDTGGVAPHPDLALLLTTSGSTGNPKLVRLSRAAVLANAAQIADSLGIDDTAVAPTTLPLFYTYGLSVLNSHLLRGATVLLEREGLLRAGFWRAVDTHGATSLAAVPYQYEMLRRLRFDPAQHPSLRTLTQAGGRLHPDLVSDFAGRMNGNLYVMYGQTEATARMTVLPPDRLADKLGSAGLPVPGGSLAVDGGEVVYTGPNVMMGYADSAADLARGDELGGVLRTGDLGHLDDEGFLFLTGRAKRIGKVFGVRVNLDDVERSLAAHGPVAAVAGDDRLRVFLEGGDPRAVRSELAERLGTHVSGLDVRAVDRLPLLPTGKIDYRALESTA